MTNQQVRKFCKIVMIIAIVFEVMWFMVDLALGRSPEWIMPFTLVISQSAVLFAIFETKEKSSHEDSQK